MTVETFDLRSARAIRKRQLSAGRAIAAVGAAVIGVIDVVVVITNHGLSLDAPLLLVQMAVSFGLVLFMAWYVLFFTDPGPVRLVLTPDGMVFEFTSGNQRAYRWDDPSLDLSILDYTGIRWTKTGSRQLVPVSLQGQGLGVYRPISLSVEAGTAILREARAHNLSLSERGTPGSLPAGSLSPHETRIQGYAAASRSPGSAGVPM